MPVDSIEPLRSANGWTSGNASYVAVCAGRRYKLRVCDTEWEAELVERNAALLPRFTARVHERRGAYLLIEFLEGYRELTRPQFLASLHDIGRMTAEAHQHPSPVPYDHRQSFRSRLDDLRGRGVISASTHASVFALYEKTLAGIDVEITLDVNDVKEANLMMNDAGHLVWVDEDGLRPGVKGLGLARLLPELERDRDWQELLRGYNEIADSSFLTPAYVRHLQLVQLVRGISINVRKDRMDRALWQLQKLQSLA